MSNIEKHRAFLDSLEGENGLPDKFYRLLIPGVDVWHKGDEVWSDREGWMNYLDYYGGVLYNNRETMHGQTFNHISSPCRRAESRQITDLKEKVKELVRDAMDATDRYWHKPRADDDREMEQFHVLCTPDKGGEVNK